MPAGFPAGVIFDMDGLLLDSERLARDAFVRACGELGWAADLAAYHRCIGSNAQATEQILRAHYGPDFPYAELDVSWNTHYQARLAQAPVPVKAGAVDLLSHLSRAGIPRALATSTRRSVAERKLTDSALREYFQHTICGGETARGKPHPEPYLRAADALGLKPAQCLALEDSGNGVRSASAAGCVVIQVPDLVTPDAEIAALAHLIVDSLTDVLHLLRQN